MELNLVGSFKNPWAPQQELVQLNNHKWFPSTDDFKVVAGISSIEVNSAWSFLLEIIKSKTGIDRLNFFSHGNTGLIAMQGTILQDGSNVTLGKPGADDVWTQRTPGGKVGLIVDPYAPNKCWGTMGHKSAKKLKPTVNNKPSTPFSLDDVRNKFNTGAEIWLYICHSGSDPVLIQEIANTFQVKVTGFSGEIQYCAPSSFPKDRHHTLVVVPPPPPTLTQQQKEALCGSGVTDFHKIPTSYAVAASPKKPTGPDPDPDDDVSD